MAVSQGLEGGGRGWLCPGRGRGQQVSAGSTEPAHSGTSSAGVLFMRGDSEESRETRSIPSEPSPAQKERERAWQQPGLSGSSSKLSDVFPRLTSPPPQHCNFTGKGIRATSCPPPPILAPLCPSLHFSVWLPPERLPSRGLPALLLVCNGGNAWAKQNS